jgi:hypothetical protein
MLDTLADLASWSLTAFGAVLVVAQFAAREAGCAVGMRRSGSGGKDEGTGLVVGSILGLLAFVLALTLSFATTRHAERRIGTLQEANAIGTAWLQAKAVGGPQGEAIADALETYIALRTEFVTADRSSSRIEAVTAETATLQTVIWGHVTALVQSRPDPVVTSLMNATNNAFDSSTAQRFALKYAVPPQLVWLLFAVTVVGMLALGYQLAMIGNPHRVLTLFMSVLWTAVMVLILDMGSGRIGTDRADPFAYDWTAEGFGEIPVPPP